MSDDIFDSPRKRFDKWAPTYEDSRRQRLLFRPSHDLVIEAMEELPHTRILDVGCGTGILARRMASRFPDSGVVGVDISPMMIKEAQSRASGAENLKFEVTDGHRLEFPDRSYDSVVCCHSFHMHPDQAASLREMYRVLREEGSLFIIDFAKFGLVSRLNCYLHEILSFGEGKINTWSGEELEGWMVAEGLQPYLRRTYSIKKGIPSMLVVGRRPRG